MRDRRTVELSVVPLISLIHKENLGDPHVIFAGGERYFSHRFAGETERLLREELAEAGLGSRDALADLVGMLATVQRARSEFYGWVSDNGVSSSVLVAASGRAAFALTRHGDRVAFDRADPDRLAECLLSWLPAIPPGRGESISVRAAELAASGARPAGSVMRRSSGTARSDQARRLDALMRAPRRGGAKLYAALRDQAGNRSRSREWLDLLDLPDGRWAVYATFGRGERAITAVPGTPQLLATKLTELQRSAL